MRWLAMTISKFDWQIFGFEVLLVYKTIPMMVRGAGILELPERWWVQVLCRAGGQLKLPHCKSCLFLHVLITAMCPMLGPQATWCQVLQNSGMMWIKAKLSQRYTLTPWLSFIQPWTADFCCSFNWNSLIHALANKKWVLYCCI